MFLRTKGRIFFYGGRGMIVFFQYFLTALLVFPLGFITVFGLALISSCFTKNKVIIGTALFFGLCIFSALISMIGEVR
jgi:hypothetical protein